MNRPKLLLPIAVILLLIALMVGCDKERIVESTEIIHEIEYIELPPDTVVIHDTIVTYDSVTIHATDTMTIFDTLVQTNTIYDTIFQTNTIYDTVIQTNTIYDTVVQTNTIYDTVITTVTVTVTDTVIQASNEPNELLAIGALQYYVDPLVLDFAYTEFGLNDGWIYYLSSWQSDFTRQSAGVYDIYGYIEYWALDWSGYYPLEFLYRISHTGGDPADPNNWTLSEPPSVAPGVNPGIKSSTKIKQTPGSLIK